MANGGTAPVVRGGGTSMMGKHAAALVFGSGDLFEMRQRKLCCWTAATKTLGGVSCRRTLAVRSGDLCMMEKCELCC